MNCIYVLELKESKYYVGRTSNIIARFNAHVGGYGSVWTNKYKPLSIIKLIDYFPFAEIAVTLEMMQKYGIENVRGSCWCKEKLTDEEKQEIHKITASENFAQKKVSEEEEDEEAPSPTNTPKLSCKGKTWTDEEEASLVGEMNEAVPVEEIAKIHGRTNGAIVARIRQMVWFNMPKSATEISEMFNLTEACIHGMCRNRKASDIQYKNQFKTKIIIPEIISNE